MLRKGSSVIFYARNLRLRGGKVIKLCGQYVVSIVCTEVLPLLIIRVWERIYWPLNDRVWERIIHLIIHSSP